MEKKFYKLDQGFSVGKFSAILALLLLLSYSIWNARRLIAGPSIEIMSPSARLETSEETLTIKGVAKNTSFLSLNGRPIYTDGEGNFEEKLLLSPGFNIIRIYGKDRFKQETSEELKIYYFN